jgi:hypothetical protein
MKQILIVGAGNHFPQGPFTFLHAIAEYERVHVKGLYFRPVDSFALAAACATSNIGPYLELVDNEKEVIAHHKTLFARQCEQQHIAYCLHGNDSEWDKDLFIRESRFADFILISGEYFYTEAGEPQPNHQLREVMHYAECPVLVIPENVTTIQHIFMAYDGSRESLYAIKQFCYLFPYLIDLPTEMVYFHKGPYHTIPNQENLKQFTSLKFDAMGYTNIHFDVDEYSATWISEKKNALLVSGSFGRSALSYINKRSFAEDIIHDHQLPVFIAHP